MRSRCHILYSLFLLVIIAGNIHPANAAVVVILDNHSSYIALSGALHVVGEVNNTGTTNVKDIVIKVTFFDIDNRAIASSSSSALQSILLPGMRSPFDVTLTGSSVVQQVDRYELEVSYSETDIILNRTLLVQSYNYSSIMTGSFHVVAEIKNNSTKISNATNAIATCYDSNGTVVAAEQSTLKNLNPGQTVSFDMAIDQSQSTKVTRYEVSAISNESIIIPEFSFTLLVLIIGCLAVLFINRIGKNSSYPIIRTRL
jgi:hypothetical protein